MTFRVPLTSSGVDTAAAGQAGVKVYEAGVPGAYYGVVEFRDGYRDDSPAQIIGRATAARSAYSAATGGLELHGGTYNGGVVAPELDLLVTPGSDGVTPVAVAKLKGAPTFDLGGAQLTSGGRIPSSARVAVTMEGGWDAPAPGCSVYRDASGITHLYGWFRNLSAFTPAGGEWVAQLPAGWAPADTLFFDVPVGQAGAFSQINVWNDGRITIARAGVGGLIAANTVWGVNSVYWP